MCWGSLQKCIFVLEFYSISTFELKSSGKTPRQKDRKEQIKKNKKKKKGCHTSPTVQLKVESCCTFSRGFDCILTQMFTHQQPCILRWLDPSGSRCGIRTCTLPSGWCRSDCRCLGSDTHWCLHTARGGGWGRENRGDTAGIWHV